MFFVFAELLDECRLEVCKVKGVGEEEEEEVRVVRVVYSTG